MFEKVERQDETMAHRMTVGTQARWQVNHAGTQALWHIDHVGMQAHMTRDLVNSSNIYGRTLCQNS